MSDCSQRCAPGASRPIRALDAFSVTAPPPALELDPFYKKYVDAFGIPIVTSAKVPDPALLVARDIVQFMLANRPDPRKELIRKKQGLGAAPRRCSRPIHANTELVRQVIPSTKMPGNVYVGRVRLGTGAHLTVTLSL